MGDGRWDFSGAKKMGSTLDDFGTRSLMQVSFFSFSSSAVWYFCRKVVSWGVVDLPSNIAKLSLPASKG